MTTLYHRCNLLNEILVKDLLAIMVCHVLMQPHHYKIASYGHVSSDKFFFVMCAYRETLDNWGRTGKQDLPALTVIMAHQELQDQ